MLQGFLLYFLAFFLALPCIHPATPQKEAGSVRGVAPPAGPWPERVLLLDDNREASVWKLRLIRSARKSIVLSVYKWMPDDFGKDVLSALLEAAERGVQEKILIDGLFGRFALAGTPEFKALAAMPGVQIKLYSVPCVLLPWTINPRMHDKYLLADDRMYILGGRNLQNRFSGLYEVDAQTRDRELLVRRTGDGGGAGSLPLLRAYFGRVWTLPTNRVCRARKTQATEQTAAALRARFGALCARWPEILADPVPADKLLPVRRIALLCNGEKPLPKRAALWGELLALLRSGRKITIESPYLACSAAMYGDLRRLTRGREIRLITNSPWTGANVFGCSEELNARRPLLRAGCRLYEYTGDASLHTKTIRVDDELTIIGSFNLDMRSAYLDTETMLAVDSPELNARIAAEEARRLTQCDRWGAQRSGFPARRSGAPLSKRALLGAGRIILPAIRQLV